MSLSSPINQSIGILGLLVIVAFGTLPQAAAQETTPADTTTPASKPVRIYRTPDERREAALGRQLTPWLLFGTVVDLEKDWRTTNLSHGRKSVMNPDPSLAIELGFELTSFKWLEAELLFAIEDNGRRHYQEVDEGFVGVNVGEFGAKVGLLYLPFGEFYSHFVTGPLLEFGQTRRPAGIIDYTLRETVEILGYVFDSQVNKQGTHRKVSIDWGLAAEVTLLDESIRIGGGYISDLGEGEGDFFLDFRNKFRRRVPGWNLHGMIGLAPFEFTGEIVHATESIREFPMNADKPLAYNFEVAYYPSQWDWIQFAVRYERTAELEDEPEISYGVGTTIRPFESLNLSFSGEYLHGTFKKGFALDADNNQLRSYDLFALQTTIQF